MNHDNDEEDGEIEESLPPQAWRPTDPRKRRRGFATSYSSLAEAPPQQRPLVTGGLVPPISHHTSAPPALPRHASGGGPVHIPLIHRESSHGSVHSTETGHLGAQQHPQQQHGPPHPPSHGMPPSPPHHGRPTWRGGTPRSRSSSWKKHQQQQSPHQPHQSQHQSIPKKEPPSLQQSPPLQQPSIPMTASIPKKSIPKKQPLRTTDLGDDHLKAQGVVRVLHALSNRADHDDVTLLPSKQAIFAGMAQLDKQVKEASTRIDQQQEAVQELMETELPDETPLPMTAPLEELEETFRTETQALEAKLAATMVPDSDDDDEPEEDDPLIQAQNERVQAKQALVQEIQEELNQDGNDGLYTQIWQDNQARAAQAHASIVADDDDHHIDTDQTHWAVVAGKVQGLGDALYREPSQAPDFAKNERHYEQAEPLLLEIMRNDQTTLQDHWQQLGWEYAAREQSHLGTHPRKRRRRSSVTVRPSLLDKPTNPYRRARREVRTEYEQEQIIAELNAKEAMEKRIATGGSDLPRQVTQWEASLTATYIPTFTAQRVNYDDEENNDEPTTSLWSDMEKCIFLDRFLQYPKDFRKIASFLRNKTTTDCVAFYYDSKQSIPYKGALREHILRRRKRPTNWDATIQAALSVGAVITAGSSEEEPLDLELPNGDFTFTTLGLHPLDADVVNGPTHSQVDSVGDPLFLLDPEQRKFLKPSPHYAASVASTTDEKKTRKGPQKWTPEEKRIFHQLVEQQQDSPPWDALQEAIGTKTLSQIKRYYNDFLKKKQRKKEASSTETPTEYNVQHEVMQALQQQRMSAMEAERLLELHQGEMADHRWAAHQQQQQLLHDEATRQLLQQQSHDEAARQLLQQHQSQQVLSNLWLANQQQQQPHHHHHPHLQHSRTSSNEMEQLQALLQLQQQQQQRQQHHHHHLGLDPHNLALAGLTSSGINPSALMPPNHMHPHDEQLALAQRLLEYSEGNPTALELLAAAMRRNGNPPDNPDRY